MELDIAAEHGPRIALEPGIDRSGERADAGDGGDAEGEAGEKDAEAAQTPAHLAPGEAQREVEAARPHPSRATAPPVPSSMTRPSARRIMRSQRCARP
jgi:hypothetical protein